RRLQDRSVAMGRRCDRAQPGLGAGPLRRLEDHHRPGGARTASGVPARLLGLFGRSLRERGAARPDRRARPRRAAVATAARPSWLPAPSLRPWALAALRTTIASLSP